MAMIATSVTALTEPLPDAAELDARLGALRRLFPRAIVDRYLRTMPAFVEQTAILYRALEQHGGLDDSPAPIEDPGV